jgi:hypothetical protein
MPRGAGRWLVVAGVLAVVGGVVAWWLWPSGSAPAPRARHYRDVDACLLTDEQGLAGGQAAAVWAGMRDASAATRARVSYLPVVGEQTSENALPYLNGLIQRRCDVVLAAGPAEVAAVLADAGQFPAVRFVVVGAGAAGGNVTGVDGSDPAGLRAEVASAVKAAIA